MHQGKKFFLNENGVWSRSRDQIIIPNAQNEEGLAQIVMSGPTEAIIYISKGTSISFENI